MTIPESVQPRWDQAARRWWEMLQDTRKDGAPNPVRDRAALARLRRAARPIDAVEEPSVIDLYKRLGYGRADVDSRLMRVAVVAAVLAQIRADAQPGENGFRRRFAELLGQGERPLMSPLRFRQLLASTEDQDLLIGFRRAVALAGARNIDIGDIAEALLDWSDRRRMRWAFDYHGAGMAAPKAESSPLPKTRIDHGEVYSTASADILSSRES
jgi:CRISPR type I-E-associated protein CasB/Cse2